MKKSNCTIFSSQHFEVHEKYLNYKINNQIFERGAHATQSPSSSSARCQRQQVPRNNKRKVMKKALTLRNNNQNNNNNHKKEKKEQCIVVKRKCSSYAWGMYGGWLHACLLAWVGGMWHVWSSLRKQRLQWAAAQLNVNEIQSRTT